MRVLNLYAGIGGNRLLWSGVDVTAVEIDETIANVYRNRFPSDNVIVGDAHEYLLNHYSEFDFIWTSPPCQTHSSFRQNICVRFRGTKPVYPDMKLYQEILFLKHNFIGGYVVENVIPYYTPLIEPDVKLQRHLFWCNFKIENKEIESDNIRTAQIPDLQRLHDVNLDGVRLKNKRQVLRNCVHYSIGEHVINEFKKGVNV
jgi:DNA (cytosine-5)-methyltransferase 1